MKTKLPNFLIVGAAKSGTTSLYHYLNQHPEVYMSPIKEPRFITAQFVKYPLRLKKEKCVIEDFEEYKKLFKHVKNEKAIGEASVDNLYYYEESIKFIKKYLRDVKVIIILRNPIESAFSNYQMLVRNRGEHLSFEDALNAEDERKKLHMIYGCGWHYKSLGFYYKQVKAYLENFSQVKVYLYDDLKNNTLGLIKDMYEFLEVDASYEPDLSYKYNVGGIPKNKFIYNILFVKPKLLKGFIEKVSKFFLLEEKIYKLAEDLKARYLTKQQMKPETRDYLKNLYREDILKLQDLIKRDLSHWLR